jgi:hypothetical protein
MDCKLFENQIKKFEGTTEEFCHSINKFCNTNENCKQKAYKCWADNICQHDQQNNSPCTIGSRNELINEHNIRKICKKN